jgi:hypothetical protein
MANAQAKLAYHRPIAGDCQLILLGDVSEDEQPNLVAAHNLRHTFEFQSNFFHSAFNAYTF